MSWLKSAFNTLAAPVIGGIFGYKGAEQQGEQAQQQSAEQMAFQERMSNTAYQRGTADMEAAGLNPMLAYSQGGASSPGGAMAPTFNKAAAAIQGAHSAAQVENLNAVTEKTKAETDNIKASKIDWEDDPEGGKKMVLPKTFEARLTYIMGEKRFQELKHELDRQDLTRAQIKEVTQHIQNLATQNRLATLNIPRAVAEAKAHDPESTFGKYHPYFDAAAKGISSAAQLRGIGRSPGRGITINNPRR